MMEGEGRGGEKENEEGKVKAVMRANARTEDGEDREKKKEVGGEVEGGIQKSTV